MKVNQSYLIGALHMEGVSDMSSTQTVASLILDYLYTEPGYRAFLTLVSNLVRIAPSFLVPSVEKTKSKESGPEGIEEDCFASLMRKLTDLRDWQIIDLFDLFDCNGDGIIRTRDLFILIALIVSADARRSTLVFYLHRKELFEILSRRVIPVDVDGDGDDSDLSDEKGEGGADDGDMENHETEHRSKKRSGSTSEMSSENRSRSRSNTDSSMGGGDTSISSSSATTPLMTFAQFCGVAIPVGVLPSRLIAILEKFGVHEGGMFSYQDYLVYGYWVLSHVDAQDDDTAPAGGDDHNHQQQQSQVGGDSQSSRFCIVM